MFLVETDWLDKNLNNVKIIDCSWHMPRDDRDGYEEYKKNHAPKLQLEHNAKFLGRFAAFRSELRVLQEFRIHS